MANDIIIGQEDVDLITWAGLFNEIEPVIKRSEKKVSPDGWEFYTTTEIYPGERRKVYDASYKATMAQGTFDRLVRVSALKVGDGLTKYGYSDAHAYTIIGIKPYKSGTVLIAQRDKATMTNRKDLTFHPGGFVGNYSDQHEQEWVYEPDPNEITYKVRVKPDGSLTGVGEYRGQHWSTGRDEFYDLNF